MGEGGGLYSAKPVEGAEEFCRELRKLRLRFGDLGYNLKADRGVPTVWLSSRRDRKGFRVWVQHRQWTTVN